MNTHIERSIDAEDQLDYLMISYLNLLTPDQYHRLKEIQEQKERD